MFTIFLIIIFINSSNLNVCKFDDKKTHKKRLEFFLYVYDWFYSRSAGLWIKKDKNDGRKLF